MLLLKKQPVFISSLNKRTITGIKQVNYLVNPVNYLLALKVVYFNFNCNYRLIVVTINWKGGGVTPICNRRNHKTIDTWFVLDNFSLK